MPRLSRAKPPLAPTSPAPAEVDLNQIVAYNVRAARELRGWTQEEVADRLEGFLGQRLTQAGVSSIERAWDGDRRREFDAHELLIFALVFELPMVWFLLPPPGDHRLMRTTTRPVDELYMCLLGRPDQLEPVYARLREIGVSEPTAAEETVEKITGAPAGSREWGYRDRRKELLLALLDEHADSFDSAVDELGRWVDHLCQVGIRGFVAEHTDDDDFTMRPEIRKPNTGTVAKGAAATAPRRDRGTAKTTDRTRDPRRKR